MSTAQKFAALFASIAASWEPRPEDLERVTEQVRAIYDKLIEWGWETVDRAELDYATSQYSRACVVHECSEWLPFDVMPNWEDDLYCLLMDEDDRWINCVNENRCVCELAETIRRKRRTPSQEGIKNTRANPFAVNIPGAPACEWIGAADRLERIKQMPVEDLLLVLERTDIQATVRAAAERRLRRLNKPQEQSQL